MVVEGERVADLGVPGPRVPVDSPNSCRRLCPHEIEPVHMLLRPQVGVKTLGPRRQHLRQSHWERTASDLHVQQRPHEDGAFAEEMFLLHVRRRDRAKRVGAAPRTRDREIPAAAGRDQDRAGRAEGPGPVIERAVGREHVHNAARDLQVQQRGIPRIDQAPARELMRAHAKPGLVLPVDGYVVEGIGGRGDLSSGRNLLTSQTATGDGEGGGGNACRIASPSQRSPVPCSRESGRETEEAPAARQNDREGGSAKGSQRQRAIM